MKEIYFSIVKLDTLEELYKGLYLECVERMFQIDVFRDAMHGLVLIQSKDFDKLRMKRG